MALCDVDPRRGAGSFKKYPKAKVFNDFRVMLDKMGKSIDACTISTPDHTHAVATMKAMQMDIAKLENKIKEAIGGDEGLLYEGGPTFVSWRQQKGSNRLDQKKLRLEEPEVFNKYSKRGDSRRVLRAHPGWGAL